MNKFRNTTVFVIAAAAALSSGAACGDAGLEDALSDGGAGGTQPSGGSHTGSGGSHTGSGGHTGGGQAESGGTANSGGTGGASGGETGDPEPACEVALGGVGGEGGAGLTGCTISTPTPELTAAWWQWVMRHSVTNHPMLDLTGADCDEDQDGPVWFLGGTFNGDAVRDCTIPAGKSVLIPIYNVQTGAAVWDCEPSAEGVPCVISELRGAAADQVEDPAILTASFDGEPIENLDAFRVLSTVFEVTVPVSGGLFDIPGGTYDPQVSDGQWLLIGVLEAGSYTIHVHGKANASAPFGATEANVTYHLVVE